MADFKTRVSDLTNFESTDDFALRDWLNEGYRELVNVFPPNLKELCYSNLKFTSTPEGTEVESISTSKIGIVFAHDLECRQIQPRHKYKAANSSSYFYATSSDPVYYMEGSKLNVLPYDSPVTYYYIASPNITETDSSVDNFPDEAEYLIVLYASCRAIHRLMVNKSSNLPTFVNIAPPSAPTMTTQSVTINGTAPTYVAPSLSLSAAPTINNLNITAVVPVAPDIILSTLTNLGVAPTYTSQSLTTQVAFNDYWTLGDFGDSDPGELNITAVLPSVPTLSDNSISFSTSAPTYNVQAVSPNYADANNWLNTEEDSEMVASRMQIIGSEIQKYQADMQNQLNIFNEANAEYQAELQKAIKNADLSSQDDSQKLQKYSSEVQAYSSQVTSQTQEYAQKLSRYQLELNTVYQAWAKTQSDNLQKYQSDMQNELNIFNKENASYQVKLNEAIKNADLDNAKMSNELQKYSNEIQIYQAQVSQSVQEYQQNFTKEFQIWQTKRQTELQEFQNNMQNKLNEFNDANTEYQAKMQKDLKDADLAESKEGRDLQKYSQELASYQGQVQSNVQDFQNNLQKQVTDYQWYQNQYAQLKQEYNQGLQMLVGANAAPQQQAQQ